MFRSVPYLAMTLMVLFLQIFILDELSIALWLRPMIFPLIVVLLPMEWRTIWVMLSTLAIGLIMDLALGGAGLYTATLLPLAVMRGSVLYITTRRSVEHGDQTSLFSRLTMRNMMIYVGAMLVLHHTMFFLLERLSFAMPVMLVATILCSALLSLLIAWPIVRLFSSKIVL